MEDIEHYNIPIYNFPYDVEEDDEDTIEENSELRVGRLTLGLQITSSLIREWINRHYCLSLSLAATKKSLSMDVPCAVASILGVL